ncbi:hypothetical protein [Streptomyces acidicola]|nr:hypothetical protein [Streptomyces acidicola]
MAFTLTELSAGDLPTALGAAALVSRQSATSTNSPASSTRA